LTNLTIHNSNRQQSSQKHKETLFGILSNNWCAQKFNIDYIQLSKLDFILMHSQTSQFQFQVKINSKEYSNHIPSDFKSMITHQVLIS